MTFMASSSRTSSFRFSSRRITCSAGRGTRPPPPAVPDLQELVGTRPAVRGHDAEAAPCSIPQHEGRRPEAAFEDSDESEVHAR